MSIESINLWQRRARPAPTARDVDINIGVHLEEVSEMFEGLSVIPVDNPCSHDLSMGLWKTLKQLADGLKSGELKAVIHDRKAVADSMGDQIVTSVGVMHSAGMNAPEIVRRIDSSNWSKFVDGYPIFNENGKVAKGPDYRAPDLTGCYELKVERLPADDTEGGAV